MLGDVLSLCAASLTVMRLQLRGWQMVLCSGLLAALTVRSLFVIDESDRVMAGESVAEKFKCLLSLQPGLLVCVHVPKPRFDHLDNSVHAALAASHSALGNAG